MRFWMNIHHPVREGLPRDAWNNIYLKAIHRYTALQQIGAGDCAAIYEIQWKGGKTVRVDGQEIPLQEGVQGLTAVVDISGNFVHEDYEFDGDVYIGHFETGSLQARREFIPLDELRTTWQAALGRAFNPRIRGGLRELKHEEWEVISSLVGLG